MGTLPRRAKSLPEYQQEFLHQFIAGFKWQPYSITGRVQNLKQTLATMRTLKDHIIEIDNDVIVGISCTKLLPHQPKQVLRNYLSNSMLGKNLNRLFLIKQHLDTLQPYFNQYNQLKELDLSSNFLTHIPEPVTQISGLTHLWLAGNMIELNVPSFEWPNLQSIDLSDNYLESLPDLSACTNLHYINLRGNGITSVPLRLLEIDGIEFLDLSYNPIGELSVDILQHLQKGGTLNLSSTSIPQPELKKIKALARLSEISVIY